MIRLAVETDLPRILEMCKAFHLESAYRDILFDPPSVEATARTFMGTHSILVAEIDGRLVGILAAAFAPCIMNKHVAMGQEVVWWVEPAHRGGSLAMKMLRALEQMARDAGISHFSMISLATDGGKADSLYARSGYHHTESTWTKDLYGA